MRILVFGTGQSYRRYKEIFVQDTIIGFLDNNSKMWGKELDGSLIYSPEKACHFQYDWLVVMSIYKEEICRQLLDIGIESSKILTPEAYVANQHRSVCRIYDRNLVQMDKIFYGAVIVEHILNANGATMAAMYLAEVLMRLGYHVTLIAPAAVEEHINICIEKGMTVIIVPTLKYIPATSLAWLDKFSLVILNSVSVINVVPREWHTRVLWWLHDPDSGYRHIDQHLIEAADDTGVETYAVSKEAKDCFLNHFSKTQANLLPFGMPDYTDSEKVSGKIMKRNDKMVFALIGKICRHKGQDVLIEALHHLPLELRNMLEVYIIGDETQVSYAEKLKSDASDLNMVYFTGVLSRNELAEMHKRKIDVTICASAYETMSGVVMEGLMNGELCIITSVIGIAEYLRDGRDCLIYEYGDSKALADKIGWALVNRDKVMEIQQQARIKYEQTFTMESFTERVQEVLDK